MMARAIRLAELAPETVAQVQAIRRGPNAVPTGRKSTGPRDDPEHREQVALFNWIRRHEGTIPALRWCFAVPNGGKRGMLTAKKLKAEGVRAGVPDLLLPLPKFYPRSDPRRPGGQAFGEHIIAHGCWIEMKTAAGRVSPEQRDWHAYLTRVGYAVHVCYSASEARAALCAYLGVNDPEPETLEDTA